MVLALLLGLLGQAAVRDASPWNPGHFESLALFHLMVQILADARGILTINVVGFTMLNKQKSGNVQY